MKNITNLSTTNRSPALARHWRLLTAMLLSIPGALVAQTSAIWTGAADTHWENPANWDTNSVPVAATFATFNSAARTHVIDVINTGSSNVTYQVSTMDAFDGSNGFTMNLNSTGAGVVTFDFTGDAMRNQSGQTNARFVNPFVIDAGRNSILKFSKNYNDGTNNVQGNYGFVRLHDNAVLDISAASFGPTVARNAWDSKIMVEVRDLEAESGATIKVGSGFLRFGTGQARDGVEIFGKFDASGGGRISKEGSARVVLSGANVFVDSPLLPRDAFGYVITANNAATAVNNVTHQNDYLNNYLSEVRNGLLVVNSNIGSVRIYNSDTATLAGTGTVGTVIFERGIISPGDGKDLPLVGTLTVNGNYEQRGGPTSNPATLWIDLGLAGNNDKLDIKGAAIIGTDSKLRISSPNGSILPGTFTFLTAAKGITGQFSAANVIVPESLTMDAPIPATVGNSLVLTLTQKPFSAVQGLTPGQMAVAGYLDYMYTQGNPAVPASYDPVVGIMNGKAIRAVNSVVLDRVATLALLQSSLNQLSPQGYVHHFGGAISQLNTSMAGIERRTGTPRPAGSRSLDVYTTFDYDSALTKASLDNEQAKLKTFYYGVGAEKPLSDRLVVGGSFLLGNGRYSLDSSGSTTDVKAYTLHGYAGYSFGKLAVGGAVFLGMDDLSTERAVEKTRQADFVTSKTNASRLGTGLWANYPVKAGWFTFKPYGSAYWMNWSEDKFSEKGNSSVALQVSKQSVDFIQTRFGLRAETEFFARNTGDKLFRLFVDVGWINVLDGAGSRVITARLNGYNMAVSTAALGSSGLRGSMGVVAEITKRLSLQIGAGGQTDATVDHQFNYQGSLLYHF